MRTTTIPKPIGPMPDGPKRDEHERRIEQTADEIKVAVYECDEEAALDEAAQLMRMVARRFGRTARIIVEPCWPDEDGDFR